MADEVERVPFRPAQNQVAITEAITGVELELHLCGICSTNRGVSMHHAVLPACVKCHNRIHAGEWKMKVSAEGLEVFDSEGQLIWRLKRWPLSGEAGDLVSLLDRMIEIERLMPELAPSLLPWQAVEVFNGLRTSCDSGWRAQMRLIGEFWEYRLPGITQGEKVAVLCGLFSLRRSQVYSYLQVHEAFRVSSALDNTPLSMRYAVEAARSEHPEEWLGVAEERKMLHPSFSSDDLKQEIIRAGDRARPTEPGEAESPRATRVWGRCVQCGAIDWHEKLPVGSDGKPVEVERGA